MLSIKFNLSLIAVMSEERFWELRVSFKTSIFSSTEEKSSLPFKISSAE